jgi:Mg-chelatase subunit ChlD
MFRVNVVRGRAILPLLVAGLNLCACGSADHSPSSSEDSKAFDVEEAPVRTTTTRREWSVGGIVTSRSETSTSERAASPAEPPSPPPPPPAQSNLLTAGDYDDLLNSDLYAKYAGRFLQAHGSDLPFVDTRTRVAIKVVDGSGRPVPFARISVSRAGTPLQLVTAADGVASVYPKFDRLPDRTRLQVGAGAASTTKALDLSAKGPRQITVALPGAAKAVSAMDLALVLDTTGSMGDEMAYLQTELDAIVARLKRDAGNLDLRIGIVLYRDEGDEYVVRSAPLTGDIGKVRATLARQNADGGGDTPEAVHLALAAAERLQWRPDAAKALLFVADAPPHDEDVAAALTSTERLRARGVQIVPVAASGVEDTAQYLMRTMAAATQGRYIFLTDDSGVGDPHAKPDVDCYVVTRLGQLIARVLAGFVQGRRIEPAQGEVIRSVGNYDRGRCMLPRPSQQRPNTQSGAS